MFLGKLRVSIAKLIIPFFYKIFQFLKANTRAINPPTGVRVIALILSIVLFVILLKSLVRGFMFVFDIVRWLLV